MGFSTTLTPEQAPWAFLKGRPHGAISTLELLATLVGLVVLDPLDGWEPGIKAAVTLTGFTDSQVASSVVGRSLTTAFPLCCVSMELSAQLEKRNAILNLDWVPRTVNAEADALADGNMEGFSPGLRQAADPSKMTWLVLDRLLEYGMKFYSEASAQRAAVTSPQLPRNVPNILRARLHDREPW